MAYTLKIVDVTGDPYISPSGVLASAWPERIRWERNAPEQASIAFPTTHPDGAEVQAFREVQIYKSGITNPLFWGPLLNPSAKGSDGVVHFGCAGAAWYLLNRHIDGIRANLLDNGDFETGTLTDWTASAGVTATADTTKTVRGAKSAKLVGADPLGDQHLHQTVSVTTESWIGKLLTVSAWYLIDSITTHALERRGLYVEALDGATVMASNAFLLDGATFEHYGATWQRAETTISIPAGVTWDIDVRLYAPQGTIYWDVVQLVEMKSTGTSDGTDGKQDLATLAERLVEHVQSGPKGSVNIDTDCPATGVLLSRNHQWAEHTPFAEGIGELTQRDDAFDWRMVYTPTTRTFTTESPRGGTDRTGTLTLTYGRPEDGHQIADYDFGQRGEETKTLVTVLGEGDGPDREEAIATDTTYTDGLNVEDVYAAPPKTPVASLQAIADERLNAAKRPTPTLTLTTHQGATDLLALLKVGDLFVVTIHHGWVNINHAYRAAVIELDCIRDTLQIVCEYEP